MINIGDKIPHEVLLQLTTKGLQEVRIADHIKDKKVILFGLVGAFTPPCSNDHVPSYRDNADLIKSKGIDEIICVSVNDPFVMKAWTDAENVDGIITMLGDWNASFSKAMGLTFDASKLGLGIRSKRYASIIDRGVLKHLDVEQDPTACTVSSGNAILKLL